jgi:hypothetical protein
MSEILLAFISRTGGDPPFLLYMYTIEIASSKDDQASGLDAPHLDLVAPLLGLPLDSKFEENKREFRSMLASLRDANQACRRYFESLISDVAAAKSAYYDPCMWNTMLLDSIFKCLAGPISG